EIEKENPEAGEAEPGSQPVAQETVSSIVNNTFYGGTNVVATSSPGAVQNVTVSFDPGDLAGLLDHLGGLGVEKEDLDELAEAIKEDGDARDEPSGFGRRVTAWLGRMSVKA